MIDSEKRLRRLESQVAYLRSDLRVLRNLVEKDFASALNKIRYVTEKVLHRLCRESEVSWGKGEPTIEKMIGPLIAREVIPRNVALHVRTIQTNASPGSHYQESTLSSTHVQVAQIALLEFLEWYCLKEDSVHDESPAPGTDTEPAMEAEPEVEAGTRRTHVPKLAIWLAVVGLVAIGLVVYFSFFASDGEPESPPYFNELYLEMQQAMPAIRECYASELERIEGLAGGLVFQVKLGDGATVEDVRVSKDALGSAVVAACVMSEIKEITYPASTEGMTVSCQLEFSPVKTVAILPFDNLTGDKDLEWLRSGVAEMMLAGISKLRIRAELKFSKDDENLGLLIIGMARKYKVVVIDPQDVRVVHEGKETEGTYNSVAVEAGKKAGAQYVVIGAYQRTGSRLWLSARLVNVDTEKVEVISEETGEIDDVLEVQAAITKKLSKIMGEPPDPDMDPEMSRRISKSVQLLDLLRRASNALRGRGEDRDLKKAEMLYRQVVSIEPRIPEAYLGLAKSLWHAERKEDQEKVSSEIRSALRKAVELRPDYNEAMDLLGSSLWQNGKSEESLGIYRKTISMKPDSSMTYYGLALEYASKGKAEESLAMCKQAMELEPRNGELRAQYGQLIALFKRDFRRALRYTEEATRMDDAGEWHFLTHAYVQMMGGDPAGCLESIEAGRRKRTPENARRYAEQSLGMEAACLVKSGNLDAARAILEKAPIDSKAKRILEKKWPEGTPAFIRIMWNDIVDALEPILKRPEKE